MFHNLKIAESSSNLRIESLNLKTQVEYQRLNSVIQKTEDVLPDLCTEVQTNSLNLKAAELMVQRRLAKMDNKVQKIKESGCILAFLLAWLTL